MTEKLGITQKAESPGYVLGWLIQNREISDADCCTVLLREYARPLELLARSLSRSPLEQLRLVDDTIAWALANRASYRGEMSGAAWLYSAALRAALAENRLAGWRKTSRLPAAARLFATPLEPLSHWSNLLASLGSEGGLLAVCIYGLGLQTEEIGFVLRLSEAQIQARIAEIQRRLVEHRETCADCAAQYTRLTEVETALRDELSAVPGLLQRSSAWQEGWKDALLRRVHGDSARRRRRSLLLQATQAGAVMLLALVGIWLAGRSLPESIPQLAQATQPAPLNTTPIELPAPTLSPVQPDEAPAVAQSAELAAVLRQARNSQSQWKTLWADVRIIHYGAPVGEVMAEQARRKQVWMEQSGFSRVIDGPLSGSPTSTYVFSPGQIQGLNLENGLVFTDSGNELLIDTDLSKLFLAKEALMDGGEYSLVGGGSAAGRTASIVDWRYMGKWFYRFWIDERYGVLLRRQTFSGDYPGDLVSDVLVTAIYFDAEFSEAIFRPDVYNAAYFANDPSGVPEIPDFKEVLASWQGVTGQRQSGVERLPGIKPSAQTPPGPDFFPGSLLFQHMAVNEQGYQAALEMFAGGYPLGQLPLGGSTILSCQRSADLSKIAYASGPPGTGNTALYLADLRSVQAGRPVLPEGITAGDYAFSPDSRKLAFFGCEKASGTCGLFVLDIPSGKLTRILSAAYADYIIWNPDGTRLALVGNQVPADIFEQTRTKNLMMSELVALAQIWHFFVVDPSNGDVVYKRGFEWKTFNAPADSPTYAWENSFKVRAAGLEGCMEPLQAN